MYYPFIILGCFFVLSVILALKETRMVWAYGTPVAQPLFGDPTGYGAAWVGSAEAAGWRCLGWAPDLKGPRCRMSYALMASPNGDHFAVIGVGTILNIPLRGTWLYTRGTDGQVYQTTDNQSCVEIDVSRQWRNQLAKVGSFAALLDRHQSWLQSREVMARPFNAGAEAEEFRQVREERFQTMARRGLIKFTDTSETHWRYTFPGALKMAVMGYSIGLLRGLTGGRIPRGA